jgi:hypothetical protein
VPPGPGATDGDGQLVAKELQMGSSAHMKLFLAYYYWLVAKRLPMPRQHYREVLVSLPQHSGR